jgi:ribosomal protein S17
MSSASPGKYVDKKCPFTGNVSIRGRILSGVVKTTKMKRTIVIRRDYLHYISKYNRFEKRHSTLPAHCSPAFLVREGQKVVVGQCRYVWLTLIAWIFFLCCRRTRGDVFVLLRVSCNHTNFHCISHSLFIAC